MPSTVTRATSSRSPIAREHRGVEQSVACGVAADDDASASGRDRLEQPADDLIGVDAVGLGLEVQQDAVAQHRQRDRA